MEEEGRASCCCCCSGGEAGLLRQNALIRLLRQKKRRQQRLARGLAAALLLLLSGALALLITGVFGGGRPPAESKTMMQPYRHSSGASSQQHQEDFRNPSAMLTAPKGNNFNGKYLEWEQEDGRAFCHGGFNYSSGNLMVPRMGIYRVFLQITYEGKNNLDCDEELRLSNTVFLIRDDYKTHVSLLSSVDSLSCSMKQWSKTLYTAGLFSLEADSRLQVTSSHPYLIVESESKVFFGAELLSQ